MSLILLLTACPSVVVNVNEADHDTASVDTADSGDDTAADSGTDTSTDTGEDSGTGVGGWSIGEMVPVGAPTNPDDMVYTLWLRDVTEDGEVDLITTTMVPGDGDSSFRIDVRPGDGDGSFGPTSSQVGALSMLDTTSGAIGDLNGDGRLDIVAGIPEGVGVYLGNGHGFDAEVRVDLGYIWGQKADLVDFDGDGTDELVTSETYYPTDGSEYHLQVWAWDDGSPSLLADFSDLFASGGLNLYLTDAVAFDAEGDGRESAALANAFNFGNIDLHLTPDRSDFVVAENVADRATADGLMGAIRVDVTGDGDEELVTFGANGTQLWDPDEALSTVIVAMDPARYAGSGAVYDLDGDGNPDLVQLGFDYTNPRDEKLWLVTALGTGTGFAEPVGQTLELTYPQAGAIDAADLDHDGCGDVVMVAGYADILVVPGVCGG